MYASIRTASFALVLMLLLSACGGGGGGGGGDDNTGPTTWFVSSQTGSDANPGTSDEPFRSITKALSLAQDGESVRVRSGSYGLGNGETFPLVVPPGVSVIGNVLSRGKNVNVVGSGRIDSALDPAHVIYATLVPSPNSRVAGLTLRNVTTHDAFESRDVTIAAAHSGAVINACRIEEGEDSAIRVMNGARGLTITNSHIEGSNIGIFFFDGGDDAKVEGTTATKNNTGVMVFFSAIGDIDLGGGAMGSQGGNRLSGNSSVDLLIAADVHVVARNNLWDGFPTPKSHSGNTGVPATIDIWLFDNTASVDVTGAKSVNPPLAPGT